jgi:uncharacterized BrkB/YihY/UPF0761 family membrane protein
MTGFGLASAAGLNAYIPLLSMGLLDRYTNFSEVVIGLINFEISFVIVALLFAAIYKLLPNIKLMQRTLQRIPIISAGMRRCIDFRRFMLYS